MVQRCQEWLDLRTLEDSVTDKQTDSDIISGVPAASQYSDAASGIANLCIIEKLRSEGKEDQSRGSPGAYPPSPGRPRGLWAYRHPPAGEGVRIPGPPPSSSLGGGASESFAEAARSTFWWYGPTGVSASSGGGSGRACLGLRRAPAGSARVLAGGSGQAVPGLGQAPPGSRRDPLGSRRALPGSGRALPGSGRDPLGSARAPAGGQGKPVGGQGEPPPPPQGQQEPRRGLRAGPSRTWGTAPCPGTVPGHPGTVQDVLDILKCT